jgi:hypothetical protein
MRNHRNIVWTAIGVALTMVGLVQHVTAQTNASRLTYLTFSQPVRLPGISLGSGTYVFELADPQGAPDVVRVLSRDRKTAYFMGFTHAASRPRGMRDDAVVSLGEAGPGAVAPITAWWPIGEMTGHEFIYPKH